MFRVPVQMIPDLDARTISIKTTWPGASPQDIEKEILIDQESYLRSIPNLERLISKAETGRANIELEFPHGTDINDILIRVNNALTQVPGYPENVDEPRIVTSSFSDNAFMYFRIQPLPGNPNNINLVMMLDYIENHISPQIERVPGVSQVDMWGGAERQVRIYVDPAKLAQREITLSELRNKIRGRNHDTSGGDMESGKRRYLLRTIGSFKSLEDIENMVIAYKNETTIRLRDIGFVELDHAEIRVKSFANGRANITLGIRRQVGSNVIETMDGVMAKVAELNRTALNPQGMQIQLTSEDVKYVKDAISVVRQNLLIGAILVTMVLFLFLRSISATLIGAIGIPICTIAAFLGLLIMGRTLNVISLAGIAFAIGMTLDNSIVVLENIFRHMTMGKPRVQATLDGVGEVWTAVLASTLTSIFVFLPVIFINEEAGQLYSDIAIAISSSILMSMLVAITIIPAACSRYVKTAIETEKHSGLKQIGNRFEATIIQSLQKVLTSLRQRIILIFILFFLTLAIIIFLTPKAEYLPEGEESKTFSFMYAPPGYNLDQMSTYLDSLHDYFLPHLDENPERFHSGSTDVPALRFVVSYVRPNMILMIVETQDPDDIDDLIDKLSEKFSEVPGMISFSSRGSIFASNLGGTRSINLDISGTDLPTLFETGKKVYERVNEVFDKPQVRPDPPTLTMGQPMLEIHPDWERATEMGFTTEQLGFTIWALSDGAFVDDFFFEDDKIDIYLYSTEKTIQKPQDLQHLLLYSKKGSIVPLSAVATIRESVNTGILRRVDGKRTITLSIVPPHNIPLESAVEQVRSQVIQALYTSAQVPAHINMQISGASDRLQSTRDALGMNFLVAILISYLLMVAIFSHWGYPLVIMTTVPIGISGGIGGLWLFNFFGDKLHLLGLTNIQQPFDMITMLGFLILIGTVVNNPILIVEQALKNFQSVGMDSVQAVVEATRTRLRPIIMSSATTILGLSPLVFLPGAGTELYRGLGMIVMSGIFFSTVITLSFLPALLSLVLELSLLWKKSDPSNI